MMMKKMIALAAATALTLGSTAAMAQTSASALSLRNAPAAKTTTVRANTAAKKSNQIVASPLLIIGVIIGAVVALELTGAIDIISDSP